MKVHCAFKDGRPNIQVSYFEQTEDLICNVLKDSLARPKQWEKDMRFDCEDLGVGGRIILSWTLGREESMGQIGFSWLRIVSSGGLV
jgi:hypothetical protein